MSHDTATQALNFLNLQPLRNIALRKFLQHYKLESISLHRNASGDAEGVLCVFPTAQFGYDSQHYPHAQRVVLINHDTLAAGLALLDQLPSHTTDSTLVFKLLDDRLLPALSQRYQMHRACSFVSFTQGDKSQSAEPASAVSVTSEVPADCALLFEASNNYSLEELRHYFNDARSRCYALRHEVTKEVLSTSVSYANDDQLHEIAALYTPPEHRRKGYAQQIVQAAARHISALHKQVRYQVRDDNFASLQLARSVGLEQFASLTHYLASKITTE